MEIIYTAKATATGERNGHVKSQDGVLDAVVRMPKKIGGLWSSYLNAEIKFAVEHVVCFDSALNIIIPTEKIETGTTTVTADVSIGKLENKGFRLAVTLEAEVPGVEKAKELLSKAPEACPYSNASSINVKNFSTMAFVNDRERDDAYATHSVREEVGKILFLKQLCCEPF